VPNIPITFNAVAGGGSIEDSPVSTNGAGVALATWRVGTTAGVGQRAVATLVDTLTGALVDTAVFTATVTGGPPAGVMTVFGDGVIAGVGQTVPIPLRAAVFDEYGNSVASATISWQILSGAGTLGSLTSTSDVDGFTTNTLTPGGAEGDIQVRASVGAAFPAVFTIFVRHVSGRAAYLAAGAFGIARTPTGQLLVSLIQSGQVQRVSLSNPGQTALTTVGGTPVVTAVDQTGQYAYVANMGTGVLSVVDVASMTKVTDVEIPGEAHSLAMAPRGDRVYVTNTSNSVFAVDVATRAIVRTTNVPSGPWGIAFWTTATDSLMYVTSRDGSAISEIDMRTGAVVRAISVTGRPHGIAIAPGGSTLYVCDDWGGEVQFVDRTTGATTERIAVPGAFGIAIAPDGNTLYVTTNTGRIAVIDVPSAIVTKSVSTGGEARQILVTPDGNTSYAANMGGWIDLVTR
jgi:YVTN family beta-propeller protein